MELCVHVHDVSRVLREVNGKEGENLKHLVTVSYLEIYNEVIKDLLNPSDKALKIREHPDMGIYVENLAEVSHIHAYQDIYPCLREVSGSESSTLENLTSALHCTI